MQMCSCEVKAHSFYEICKGISGVIYLALEMTSQGVMLKKHE